MNGGWNQILAGTIGTHHGPALNNALPNFVAVGNGGNESLAMRTANSRLVMNSSVIPVGINRSLRVRACLQGEWKVSPSKFQGVLVQSSELSDPSAESDWTTLPTGSIGGWDYDSVVATGDVVTTSTGASYTVDYNGGWIDFDIAVGDTAQSVRLEAVYLSGVVQFSLQEPALYEMEWTWDDPPTPLAPPHDRNTPLVPAGPIAQGPHGEIILYADDGLGTEDIYINGILRFGSTGDTFVITDSMGNKHTVTGSDVGSKRYLDFGALSHPDVEYVTISIIHAETTASRAFIFPTSPETRAP